MRPRRAPSRRLAMLFLLALFGVLSAVGLVVSSVAGRVAAAAYGVVVVAAVLAGAARARQRLGEATRAGRTCTCCTSSVHDPVRVI